MFSSPETIYPLACGLKRTVFLKNIITRKNIIVGDYTYYDDLHSVHNFEKNVMYHEEFIGDKLIIGKFCQIAQDVVFMMNAIFHQQNLSTFPFALFDEEIVKTCPESFNFPVKENTEVGNDVWIGYKAIIMPGIKIGDGAIIGTGALVTKDIEPYTIVGGNPARIIRKRFHDSAIEKLLEIQWWNWPIEIIIKNVKVLLTNDIAELEKISETMSDAPDKL